MQVDSDLQFSGRCELSPFNDIAHLHACVAAKRHQMAIATIAAAKVDRKVSLSGTRFRPPELQLLIHVDIHSSGQGQGRLLDSLPVWGIRAKGCLLPLSRDR